ncbi:MAG: hypothetical protein FJ011_24465 [Chloroflexi bacterium]|nr:hypothetical protein [Chloroflexota bacterium]
MTNTAEVVVRTWREDEITGVGTFSTHNLSGDTLYGADIAVETDSRKQGISRLLYAQRKKLMKRYNLRRMVAYGRIPGYARYAGKMTADEYVQEVVRGKIKDPTLKAHLRAGYQVKRVVLDLMRDGPSLNYCTLLEMSNPNHGPGKRKIAAAPLRRPVRKTCVCAAQYRMHPIASWEELERSAEFFVSTADKYYCHFVVLPELFTAQLFNIMPREWDVPVAARELAGYTDRALPIRIICAE